MGDTYMKIPTDITLATYIRRLIAEDKVEQFYYSEDWKELRQEVLDELYHECQECLKKGEYTKAVCVHHHNEVRQRPDLALSKYYIDNDGKKKRNLIPLCNKCHNLIHEKLIKWQQKNKFVNEEKW